MASDPVQLLIQAGAIPASPFAANSRYFSVAIVRYVRSADDPGTPYVLRRFIPQMRDIAVAAEHIVSSGERTGRNGAGLDEQLNGIGGHRVCSVTAGC